MRRIPVGDFKIEDDKIHLSFHTGNNKYLCIISNESEIQKKS